MMEKRYLPIIKSDGNLIERADLFLLARMGYGDEEDSEEVVAQLYQTMLQAEQTRQHLNAFERDIEKRHVRRKLQSRVFAGQVILDLTRIAAFTGEPPSAARAIRLTAHNHHLHTQRSSVRGLEEEIRKAFSEFRSTAHLQGALVLGDPTADSIENSPTETLRFLARARGLEYFVDSNVVNDSLKWDPWRVPVAVEPYFPIKLPSLTAAERSAIGV